MSTQVSDERANAREVLSVRKCEDKSRLEARGERHTGKTERADGNCKCDEETRNVSAEAKKGIFRKFFFGS